MKKIYKYSVIFFLITSLTSFQSHSQNANAIKEDSIAVLQKLNEFVDAFSNLKWEKFIACFADDATTFFPPSADFSHRANNKIEIENIFRKVFENARKQKQSAPYIIIQPKDLKIQMLNSIAIITFELNDPDMFGRRTIVMQKQNDKWLIVHLHASGIATNAK